MAVSAGLLMYRRRGDAIQVLIAHPGGPFFAKKNAGAWTIPKGLVQAGEDLEAAARREFVEETGFEVADTLVPLGSIKQKSGKIVHAFAFEGDADPDALVSNTFEMVVAGRRRSFPEVDRVRFVDPEEAAELLNPAQVELVARLLERAPWRRPTTR